MMLRDSPSSFPHTNWKKTAHTLILTHPLSFTSSCPPLSSPPSDVHALLTDFLPADKYFRFNPLLPNNLAIDEKNKSVLLSLKSVAKQEFTKLERGPDKKNMEFMISSLKSGLREAAR